MHAHTHTYPYSTLGERNRNSNSVDLSLMSPLHAKQFIYRDDYQLLFFLRFNYFAYIQTRLKS